jgi:hypothetical protein
MNTNQINKYFCKHTKLNLTKKKKKLQRETGEELQEFIDLKFSTAIAGGKEVELKPGGFSEQVT